MKNFVFSVDIEKDYFNKKTKGIEVGIPRLLNLLSKHNVKATFFTTACIAEKFPNLIKKISKKHEIACHGYKHEKFAKLSKSEQYKTIKKATEIIETITKRPQGFRAPHLSVNNQTFEVLNKLDYTYDSSIPIIGLKKYRKLNPQGIKEVVSIPSFILRMPFGNLLLKRLIKKSNKKYNYSCFFIHSWEITKTLKFKPKKLLHIYNYYGSGKPLIKKLDNLFSQDYNFKTALEVVE